jgi:hypothetical protein
MTGLCLESSPGASRIFPGYFPGVFRVYSGCIPGVFRVLPAFLQCNDGTGIKIEQMATDYSPTYQAVRARLMLILTLPLVV